MFTSRAEYRLRLRADNADQRLTQKADEAGFIGAERRAAFATKMDALATTRCILEGLELSPNALKDRGLLINQDGVKRTAFDVLAYPDVDLAKIRGIWPELVALDDRTGHQLAIEATYQNYLDRQDADIRAFRRDEALALPEDLNFDQIPGLSNEVRLKLAEARPATLGVAARIPGVTPAAVTALLGFVHRQARTDTRISA